MVKEMVGGCCVCSEETGSPENPLVYCDGEGCTVAVHQACYGIQTVPQGPWYCRKCESPEPAGRVRCELCPLRDGAFKRTDKGGWAHVICALYIPEVRFGDVRTMEPIILKHVPNDRYHKSCYLCLETGKESKASSGACMQCSQNNCKNYFHVTCAQAVGLLCEEVGSFENDAVKYCGYCSHHYNKILNSSEKVMSKDVNSKRFTLKSSRKDYPTIKPIPAFKPIPSTSSDRHRDRSPSESSRENAKKSSPMTSSTSNKDKDRSTPTSRSDRDKDSNNSNVKKNKNKDSSVLDKSLSKKDNNDKDRLGSKEKEVIPSRPVDERPAGGQFSLSSFINPNLANKQKQQQQQLSQQQQNKQPNDSSSTLSKYSLSPYESTKNSSSTYLSKSSTSSSSSTSAFDKTKSSSSTVNTNMLQKIDPKDRAAALFDAVVKQIPIPVPPPTDGKSSATSSSSKDKNVSNSKDLNNKKKNESPSNNPKSTSSTLGPKPGSLLSMATSMLSSPEKSSSSKSSPNNSKSSSNVTSKENHQNHRSRTISDSTTESESDDDDEPPKKKTKTSKTSAGNRKLSRLSSSDSSSTSSLDIDDDDDNRSSNRNRNRKVVEKEKKKVVTKKSSTTLSTSNKSTSKSSGVSQGNNSNKTSNTSSSAKNKSNASKSLHKGSSSPARSSVASKSAETVSVNGTGKKSSPLSASVLKQKPKKSTKKAPVKSSAGKSPKFRALVSDDDDDDDDDLDSKDNISSTGIERTPNKSPAMSPPKVSQSIKDSTNVSKTTPTTSSTSTSKVHHVTSSPVRSSSLRLTEVVPVNGTDKPSTALAKYPKSRTIISDDDDISSPRGTDPTEPPASSLEALLERQWAQGSQFIMDQAQHYDIASLLSCLTQLRSDNERLEERLRNLTTRRERLFAVNARLCLLFPRT